MRIITHKAISQYAELHADVKIALDEWYIKTEKSQWDCFADVKNV
jgi:mRNA-degrading endonuclease HigB of HigAB toxin-antitoxin module